MTSIDTYKTFSKIDINGKKFVYFDLNKLANHFKLNFTDLPFSKKILLENLIRNEDGKLITADMISSFCSQLSNKNKSFEGKLVEVLVENRMQNQLELFGRNKFNNSVIFAGDKNNIGKIVQVKIESTNQNSLFGRIENKKNMKAA